MYKMVMCRAALVFRGHNIVPFEKESGRLMTRRNGQISPRMGDLYPYRRVSSYYISTLHHLWRKVYV